LKISPAPERKGRTDRVLRRRLLFYFFYWLPQKIILSF